MPPRRRAALSLLLAAVLAAAVLADGIEAEDLNNGRWDFARGHPDCPKVIAVSGEGGTLQAGNLAADGTNCVGAGVLALRRNPPSGGGKFAEALRREGRRDDSLEATQEGALTCGSLALPSGLHWVFFSPKGDFSLNPSTILGGPSALLAAETTGDVRFDEDKGYLLVGELCMYKQEGRIARAAGSACFPAEATVELEDGSVARMDAVAVGDAVKVGPGEYSRIFMFTHRLPDAAARFVALQTVSGPSLTLTPGHYVYADGALVAASEVAVGAALALGDGRTATVASCGEVAGAGLFNPQTVHGDIVVNGIVASTYTTAVEPRLAHAALAPLRCLTGLGLQFTGLEGGGGVLAGAAPSGRAVL
jgi:Hint module